MLSTTSHSITFSNNNETIRVEAVGQGIRVTAVPYGQLPEENWALDPIPAVGAKVVAPEGGPMYVENCGIRCHIQGTHLSFTTCDGRLLTEEEHYEWPLHESARSYRPTLGSDGFEARVCFRAFPGEILHGMGQYRNANYNLKGCHLELAHRNSQISVPFFLSSRGYGFLWNNPAIGTATFAENVTQWKASSTKAIDYWVCTAGTPGEILEKYTQVTGRPTPLPESLLGLWQCKLRYRTQEEVLEVAREYHRRGIRLDVIVIDFFHWVYQGDWDFDPEYWPDPRAMVDELRSYGTRLMVSVWPTVDPRSKNYRDFQKNGYLISTDRGLPVVFDFNGPERIYDATNPHARKFAAGILKRNYGKYGIDLFWLDEAEPEYSLYHSDLYRYHLGPAAQVGNLYPRLHTQMVYDGLREDGAEDILSLVRCAWVGSPKYGALVWSGDIDSSFPQMRRQIANGINMGTAGIPYWICDTGGFYGGNIHDPVFRELLVRWFQWAVFTPVLRMHGDRQPGMGALTDNTDRGGGFCASGSPNELWSYGEEALQIFLKYLNIRHSLKDYILKTARQAQEKGLPMIRGMYLEFPEDETAWTLADQYMFGEEYLVAPVTVYGARQRQVYLPRGTWQAMDGSATVQSTGQYVTANAPLDYVPVFRRV